MPAWALRLLAATISAASMFGSTSYVLAHPKNPAAPLQPPVAERQPVAVDPEPTLAPIPFRTLAPTPVPTPTTPPSPTVRASVVATPRPAAPPTPAPTLRPTPVPIVLGPGVRATTLPKVTVTHSS